MDNYDFDMLMSHTCGLLWAIDEDTNRPGLVDTPKRVASFWKEFIDYDPGSVDTTFECIQVDQMVIFKGIVVWSICEHHLLPFSCNVSVGYITNECVIGASKIARIVQKHAHRLQIQERLVDGIAREVQEITQSIGVAVIATDGMHTCIQMRGIKSGGSFVTSAMYGVFRDKPEARNEFLMLVRG